MNPVRRADAAAAETRKTRWSRLWFIGGIGFLTLVNAVRLGWPGGPVAVGVTLVVGVVLLRAFLAFDQARKRRHMPEGVKWRADAVLYGHELERFTGRTVRRVRPETQVVGWLDVGEFGLRWIPRPRFDRRGVPDIEAPWRSVAELSWTHASSASARWLAQVDVFTVDLDDGRTLSLFVTTPGPFHDALRALGKPAVELDSPWPGWGGP